MEKSHFMHASVIRMYVKADTDIGIMLFEALALICLYFSLHIKFIVNSDKDSELLLKAHKLK